MRQTAREFSVLGVTEIARTVCELLEWTRPNGRLKNHECRQLLERLQAEGFPQASRGAKTGREGSATDGRIRDSLGAGARHIRRQ